MSGFKNREELHETTRRADVPRARAARATVPCLTILGHPDPHRIGQRALLGALLAGRRVSLSRLEPLFSHPGGAAEGEPLADPYLSRTPVYLDAPGAGLGVAASGANVADVFANGAPLDRARMFDTRQLAAGIVLTFGDRVALLLHETANPAAVPVPGLVGASDAIAQVRQEIAHVAKIDVPVLIRGETGTGKELVARAIHDASLRASRPWVAVNMAALAESMAVSTLFGHAKGAFTGAQQRHRGLFEQASEGTLFLDEIGDTPEKVQPMLLRTLETGTILPLGEDAERAVDVRIIAATDADLEQDLAGGSFSAALFHRLSGYEIRIPPLGERRDDVPRLFFYFLALELQGIGRADLLQPNGGHDPVIPLDVILRVVNHPLPGNVRQLRNAARHLAVSNQNEARLVSTPAFERFLAIDAAPAAPAAVSAAAAAAPAPASGPQTPPAPSRRPSELTDQDLLTALEQCGWSPVRTAAQLGLATSTLHDLLRRHGIRRAADVPDEELEAAKQQFSGDLAKMAAALRVSERALRLTLRQR